MISTHIQRRSVPAKAQAMMAQQGLHPLLAQLYAARGVTDIANAQPNLKTLLDPAELHGIDDAAQALSNAIVQGESICVVADYDCDGATACAVAVLGLNMLTESAQMVDKAIRGAQVDFFVPNRFETGYGLVPEVVDLVIAKYAAMGKPAPDWLLTVDNGIASVAGVAYAATHGIRVCITDHHVAGDVLPDAAVIVNPNQPACGFASKHLAGVGVLFYVLLATRAVMRAQGLFDSATQARLDTLLDLVALGTVADVVRLDANNRTLVSAGIERIRAAALNGTLRAGIQALYAVAGRDPRAANATDFGFMIGPRINAAGRLADMSLGIACLLTDDLEQATRMATELQKINATRRDIQDDMQAQALDNLPSAIAPTQASVVAFHADWHQGVVGLVASKLKEQFWRPAFAFASENKAAENNAENKADDNATLRGSGRSIPGLHLRDALDLVSKRAPHLIEKFGGHAMAAGLSLPARHLDEFTRTLESVCQSLISPAIAAKVLLTDGAFNADWCTPDMADMLARSGFGTQTLAYG